MIRKGINYTWKGERMESEMIFENDREKKDLGLQKMFVFVNCSYVLCAFLFWFYLIFDSLKMSLIVL